MIKKTLFPNNYGIAFLSVDLFMEEIRNKKCRARKFISYFNKHRDQYFQFIEQGLLVPFHPVNAGNHLIYIETEKDEFVVPEGYKIIFQYDDFYLKAGKKGIMTLASFGHLEYYGKNIAAEETARSYKTLDGEECSSAIDFPLKEGEYQVSLIALKKIIQEKERLKREENYAYGFLFTTSEHLVKDNLTKCDDELYDFRLPATE